jgi:hypothetical protein
LRPRAGVSHYTAISSAAAPGWRACSGPGEDVSSGRDNETMVLLVPQV